MGRRAANQKVRLQLANAIMAWASLCPDPEAFKNNMEQIEHGKVCPPKNVFQCLLCRCRIHVSLFGSVGPYVIGRNVIRTISNIRAKLVGRKTETQQPLERDDGFNNAGDNAPPPFGDFRKFCSSASLPALRIQCPKHKIANTGPDCVCSVTKSQHVLSPPTKLGKTPTSNLQATTSYALCASCLPQRRPGQKNQ